VVGGSGFFQHGHTYIGHATACAAALAVQQTIKEDNLLPNVLARGEQLRASLRSVFANHPNVGDVRGRGLFVGVELVADRVTKQPLDAARHTHSRVKSEAMTRGLLVYPMGGTVDGRQGDHILIAPPFISTSDDIDRIVERLIPAIDAALA
jgi:adenosylmethionine-8-amino-7-oxononanoate aminotransferase